MLSSASILPEGFCAFPGPGIGDPGTHRWDNFKRSKTLFRKTHCLSKRQAKDSPPYLR